MSKTSEISSSMCESRADVSSELVRYAALQPRDELQFASARAHYLSGLYSAHAVALAPSTPAPVSVWLARPALPRSFFGVPHQVKRPSRDKK